METNQIYSLTSGSVNKTFDEAVAGIFNYGFRQSVFEVERLNAHTKGKNAQGSGEIVVLRASASPVRHPLLKPGNQVHCPGLAPDRAAPPVLYRIRRMAEGFSRSTMTELL